MKYHFFASSRNRHACGRGKHRGFSLITTLILLIVVTMLGIGASQMVLLSERSTRFDRDQKIAFQAAGARLDAEFDIRGPGGTRMTAFSATGSVGFVSGCGADSLTRGLCLPSAPGEKPVWYLVDFANDSTSVNPQTVQFGAYTGRTLSTGSTGIRSEIPPRYIIELIPDNTPGSSASKTKVLFRVTAMGFGPRKETQAVVQMIFRKE